MIILILVAASVITFAYGDYVTRDRTPISYHVIQDNYPSVVSLDEAKKTVTELLDITEENMRIESSIKVERQIDTEYWILKYYDDDQYCLRIKMDANSGRIISMTDHRHKGSENNVENEKEVTDIAETFLENIGLDVSNLPEPEITSPHKAGSVIFNEYCVKYEQYYHGIPVLRGYVKTRVDADSLEVVGYTNALVNIDDIDVTPKVTKLSATKAASEYFRSQVIQDKGYGKCIIKDVDLYIGQVRYDPFKDALIVPQGEPQLMWYVTALGENSRQIGVMVDPSDVSIIGLEE